MKFDGARALVTGGLGFIGSNLAIRLVELGATVTVVDSLLPGCGGNLYNVEAVRDRLRIVEADISDTELFHDDLKSADFIFNLAGEISHVHSMQFPERDLQVNALAQLRFLLACRDLAPRARIVYAGTRQVYGVPEYLPVDEAHPIAPVDFNGIHKFAATSYHLMLSRAGVMDAVVLGLTNVYGPRMALDIGCQGFLSTFIRHAVLGQRIEVFGDGTQLRDPIYVDDATEAFLLASSANTERFRSFNAGGSDALTVAEIASVASKLGNCPEPAFRPFPPDRKSIDIGSYHTDNGRIVRELQWKPLVSFADGLERTLAWFRQELPHYLDPGNPSPACRMPEHTAAPRRLVYGEVNGSVK